MDVCSELPITAVSVAYSTLDYKTLPVDDEFHALLACLKGSFDRMRYD